MELSIGSDGERSLSCGSPYSPAESLSPPYGSMMKNHLKFSVANILRPDFGVQIGRKFEPRKFFPTLSPAASPSGSFGLEPPVKPETTSVWPAWIYCTRYSDRPSSGPRCRKLKPKTRLSQPDDKRPRTAFSSEQLNRLKSEFQDNQYLTEKKRHELAHELGLHESQIKIWFQNKRAKNKKQNGLKNPLAFALISQGLYNHSTVPVDEDMSDS